MFYTYILRSLLHPEQRYIGSTSDLKARLAKHNAGEAWSCYCIENVDTVCDNASDSGGEPHTVTATMMAMPSVMRTAGKCERGTKTHCNDKAFFHKTHLRFIYFQLRF